MFKLKKLRIISLFILFLLPLPVALLGSLLTGLWFVKALITHSMAIESISAFIGILIGGTYIVSYIFSVVMTIREKKISNKTFAPLMHCLVAVIYLLSINFVSDYVIQTTEYFGFAKKDFAVVEQLDTHGGFLGDGEYYLIFDCSDNKELAREKIKDWKKLPLSHNLDILIYGGEKESGTYYPGLAEEAHIPEIKNGYYIFEDRHQESADSADDTELFNRFSYNFSIAIYDCDTDRMYYFAYDT